MENYSYSSYPDSSNSSPRSREIDCENGSWDDQPLSSSNSYKVKLMCSYGGKIHPRPHDNQLTYVGGDTKILAVDRNIRFSPFLSKLSNLCDSELCLRYQLPGEDLDALISVTNDEDLEHMMMEYDRLYRASSKPARLRLFLFPGNPPGTSFGSGETKSERQWFVDALNSVQIQPLDVPQLPSSVVRDANPDFLFGLDKGHAPPATIAKEQDPPPALTVPDVFPKETQVIGVSAAEIQRQIQEFQRFQIAGNEQGVMYYRKNDEPNPRVYSGVQEKLPPPPQPPAAPANLPTAYWQERQVATGGYPAAAATGPDQPVYLIQTPAGVYQAPALRPVTSQVAGQAYYGMQRVVPEMYREQPVYSAAPPPSSMGMVRPPAAGAGMAEQGYSAVAYEGRQVYYTAPGGAVPQYQTVNVAVDGRSGGGGMWSADGGKVVGKPSEASSV